MLRLYNTQTKQFLNLKEGTNFSFRASSQMQNLDKYEVGHSFDIELVNDENARIAVNYEEYQTGESWSPSGVSDKTIVVPLYSFPKIIMYKDGTPLFIGRMKMLGSDLNSIKAVYSAVPYGPALKDFDMRKQLRDYMYSEGGYKFSSLTLKDIMSSNIVAMSQDKIPDVGLQAIAVLEFENIPNYIPMDSNVVITDKNSGRWDLYTAGQPFRPYWMTTEIDSILECMNIKVPTRDPKELPSTIAIPCRPHWKRLLKVRMWACPPGYRMTRYVVDYKASSNSQIFWLDDYTGKWSDISSGHSGFNFKYSLRKNKGLDGLTLLEIQYPPTFGKTHEVLGLNSYNTFPSVEFGVSSGKVYKDAEDILIRLSGVDPSEPRPEYVDVIFEYDTKIDYQKFTNDPGYMLYYSDVPIMAYDFEFFETETTTFLNELSLNNSKYKWLRNPAFRNTTNYKAIHGYDSNIFYSYDLNHNNVEDVYKEIDYEAPSGIRVVTPMGFNTFIEKRLNFMKTETNEIRQVFTGLGIIDSAVSNTAKEGYPLAIYDLASSSFVENEIKGCFGTKVLYDPGVSYNARPRTPLPSKYKWLCDCNSDYDYMYNVANKGEKYVFTCVGYELQEFVEFEGRLFCVDKYTTEDFNKFKLECYPYTFWTDASYEDPNEDMGDTRTPSSWSKGKTAAYSSLRLSPARGKMQ